MMLKLVFTTLLLLQLWQDHAVAQADCEKSKLYSSIEKKLQLIIKRVEDSEKDGEKLRALFEALQESIGKSNDQADNYVRQKMGKKLAKLTKKVGKMGKSVGHCCNSWETFVSQLPSLMTAATSPAADATDSQDDTEVDEYFDVFGSGKKEWRLAFRGTPYINVGVYNAYVNGIGVPDEVEPGCKQFNENLPCANQYRNDDAINDWNNIQEVLFAIYDDGGVAKYVRFDGTGSDYVNWFSDSRIIASSWTDLATLPHNHFSIAGEPLTGFVRRFYMSNAYGGCPHDTAWFYAGESVNSGCDYERKESMPEFHYAPGNTVAVMADPSTKKADAIGIFLKYAS